MSKTLIELFNQKRRNYKKLNSILITGTKGKTSVSLMLNYLFTFAQKRTLYVNTSGVYQNDKKIFSSTDSANQFGFSPTVMPGRYVHSFLKSGQKLTDFTAILESSLSCGIFGTGIYEHRVGALLNIYSDHIGNGVLYKRQDLYKMKSFIFLNLSKNGYYVANLDNDLSRASLDEKILLEKNIHKIAFTKKKITHEKAKSIAASFDLSDLLYLIDGQVFSLKKGLICQLEDFVYLKTFFNHQALIANLLAFLAIGLVFFKKDLILSALEGFRYPFEFGRMMIFEDQITKQKIIVDFAHERVSLQLMLKNIQINYKKLPYLITRVPSSKTNSLINSFARMVAKFNLSGLTIYDTMGQKNQTIDFGSFQRYAGEVAGLIDKQLKKIKTNFPHKVVVEELAALENSWSEGHPLILHIHSDIEQLKTFVEKHSLVRVL